MKAAGFRLLIAGVAGLSLLGACSRGCAQSSQTAKSPAATAAGGLGPYVSKSVIERPTEQLLATATAFVNPKVEPGKVTWHADFATARAASAKSGKPVLLFQMMGKLDDQFC
jgi:hypothetical protein